MAYSAKKPYQKPSKDYVRFLKKTIGPESVFEKPYRQPEYTEMNQAPNTPGVPPPVGGLGELKCLYNTTNCEITVGCYAGAGIRIVGGPEEADAGYENPKIIQGAIINWAIQEDVRAIEINLDPTVSRNVVEVTFIDGWGKVYTELVDVSCAIGEQKFYLPSTGYRGAYKAQNGSTVWAEITTNQTYLGYGVVAGYNYHFCLLFESVNINPAETIQSANVSLYGGDPTYGAGIEVEVRGHDDDTGDPVNSEAEWDSVVAGELTTAAVQWDFDATSVARHTVDITGIVQEIVNRGGWSYGNNMQIFFLNDQTSVAYYFRPRTVAGDAQQPILSITI